MSIGNSSKYFLSIDFEKNPLNSEADYGLNITSESVEVVYHEVGSLSIIYYSYNSFLDFFFLYSLPYLHYLVSFITIKK